MEKRIQISVTRDVYERLSLLMVPPLDDANAVIDALLFQDGHPTAALRAAEADTQHFTFAQELERANQGVYDSGGCT